MCGPEAELGSDIPLRGGAVLGFLFRCGHAQSGLFTGIDGLLGLGRLPVSLVGQAAGAYGGAFSYCFPTKPSIGVPDAGRRCECRGAGGSRRRSCSAGGYCRMQFDVNRLLLCFFSKCTLPGVYVQMIMQYTMF
uniref:Xylanase inhibitor N-terminal domain-containing protein n=1 Tax=Setaria viridis TaxID=4556 RepID=A0A4U6TWG3_SETVI|nr:LOW QUALITY PROTEIN: hypothetical protein SEVIR_7G300800v2 [Setaria viridis]